MLKAIAWAVLFCALCFAHRLALRNAMACLQQRWGALRRPTAEQHWSAQHTSLILSLLSAVAMQPQVGHAQTSSTETITHDERGNVSGITRDGQAATYQYDMLDRLKAETGPSTQSITYDANGNRTGDASSTYTVAPNSNRLATRNGQNVIHDAAGNVTRERVRLNGSLMTRTLAYNDDNQLAKVSINGVQVASYLYDHLGLRGQKTLVNPPAGTPAITLYIHDPNGHLFQEIAGSGPRAGQALVTYAWKDDIPAAVIFHDTASSQRIVYLEVDHLNTPRRGTDSTGKVVWTWTSDAFGNTAPNEDPDGDGIKTTINLRFPGQYFDAESGLHYNWHRYYDPQVGRYTQPDPIGLRGGINPYAYVEGNPLNHTDFTGLIKICTVPGGCIDTNPPPVMDPDRPNPAPSYTPLPQGPSLLCQVAPLACAATIASSVVNSVCSPSAEDCRKKCDVANTEQVRICKMALTPRAREACYSRANELYGQCLRKCK